MLIYEQKVRDSCKWDILTYGEFGTQNGKDLIILNLIIINLLHLRFVERNSIFANN